MMAYERQVEGISVPHPESPPGMTTSKSSKSSSFTSVSSDDRSVLADGGHFEDIGLEDDTIRLADASRLKIAPSPYVSTYAADRRTSSVNHSSPHVLSSRDLSKTGRPQHDSATTPRVRPALSSLQGSLRGGNMRSTATGQLYAEPHMAPVSMRSLSVRSSSSLSVSRRRRSPSPGMGSLGPRDPNLLMKPRRSSWQSGQIRKSSLELERECDEDDGDEIPDGLVLDNVPISPRPLQERTESHPSSKAASPERVKDRVRSVGNGTPPVAVAQGSLRSPTWKTDPTAESATSSRAPSPIKPRAMSWTLALAELNAEAKALTEKLEAHAEEVELRFQRSSTGSMPIARRSSNEESRTRHKSALAELPPLRRTNIMIDPLPISKEKEAVLSRTRPSWLPPKDPVEERRHLREYRKMMVKSIEADKRREATRKAQSDCRDTAADSLMRIWEYDIFPRWNDAIRERRTRELWWHGIAPRSRGIIWSRAIGNELGLTEMSYNAALGRAQEAEARVKSGQGSAEDARQATWFEAIRRDVEQTTWKDLKIFQDGGPLHQGLVDLLSAYATYRSDIGYVPGCNTIAALLLLNLPDSAAAFTALANILNRPLPLSFYASDAGAKASAYNLVLQMLSQKYTSLYEHLIQLPDHDPDVYLDSIFTSLFTSHLAIDEAARLWDVYFFEADAVLVRAAVALLSDREMELLGTKSVEEVKSVLENRESKKRVVGRQGEEDRWMKAVRQAGKS